MKIWNDSKHSEDIYKQQNKHVTTHYMALWLILVLRPDFPGILKYLNRKQERLEALAFIITK